MKRQPLIIGIAAVLVLGGIGFLSTKHQAPSTKHQQKATYYCPMHPTYTSDRPGDCPICNMKLVKRESEPMNPRTRELANSSTRQPANPKDICYLHNCEKLHGGTPCPMTVVAKPGETVTCPVCGKYVAGEGGALKKVLYWTDPMLPGYRAEGPGKSPMGMDLVPVYEEAQPAAAAGEHAPDGYAAVMLTPQKQQLIGVTTAPAKRSAMTKTIRTVGRVAYDPQLYQAQQEYLQALRAAAQATLPEAKTQAERLAESSRIRLRLLGMSDALLEEMAGWDGPDKRLLLSDPTGRVWVYAPVYEFELPLVQVGQTLTVETAALPGQTLAGAIRAIDPVLDPATRSARVRAVLADPEGRLKPEMFVNATITVTLGEVLSVPESAVFDTGTETIVFVDRGEGVFEPRHVVLGAKADGAYEVKAGVAEGEPVVTSGNFLIDSESRLKAALQGVSPSTGSGQAAGGHQHGQ
jgi:hypothetical protein